MSNYTIIQLDNDNNTIKCIIEYDDTQYESIITQDILSSSNVFSIQKLTNIIKTCSVSKHPFFDVSFNYDFDNSNLIMIIKFLDDCLDIEEKIIFKKKIFVEDNTLINKKIVGLEKKITSLENEILNLKKFLKFDEKLDEKFNIGYKIIKDENGFSKQDIWVSKFIETIDLTSRDVINYAVNMKSFPNLKEVVIKNFNHFLKYQLDKNMVGGLKDNGYSYLYCYENETIEKITCYDIDRDLSNVTSLNSYSSSMTYQQELIILKQFSGNFVFPKLKHIILKLNTLKSEIRHFFLCIENNIHYNKNLEKIELIGIKESLIQYAKEYLDLFKEFCYTNDIKLIVN